VAAEHPPIPSLVLLAPYLQMPRALRRQAYLIRLVSPFVPFLRGRGGEQSIHDDAERPRNLSYGVVSGRLGIELLRVVELARAALSRITMPTLMIASRQDNRISAADAAEAFSMIAAPERRLEWLEQCGHVITVDLERDRVATLVADWLARHAPSSEAVPASTIVPAGA
jgi:carboxylesterase